MSSINFDLEVASRDWPVLLPEQKLSADQQHVITSDVNDIGTVTHLRMSIFPDGGISRLRINGYLTEES